MRYRWAVCAIPALAAWSCTIGPSLDNFLEQVRETAGKGATDCGVVPLPEPRAAALSCASAALKENRSFQVVFQVMGIDSQIFEALAADGQGNVWRMTWDSDITGGSEIIGRRQIWKKPCVAAGLTERAGAGPIECEE